MKKILLFLIIGFLFIIIANSCYSDTPKVDIIANLTNLSDKEFSYVGTKGIENPSKDDFINFHFRLKITNLINMRSRDVELPNFKEIINGFDIERYWAGESVRQNISNENFLYYENKYLIFKRGLDAEQLKEMFSTAEVKIIFVYENGRKCDFNYNIGEIIKIQ